jgi:hypothetical protein
MKRRGWTVEHVRTLKRLARKKKRAAEIAQRLKRTEVAIRQKAFSLGLSLETRTIKKIVGDDLRQTDQTQERSGPAPF